MQYLGTHRLETDAAMAYDAASWFIMGAMAVVNFPGNDYDVIELPRPPPQWLVASLLKARFAFGRETLMRGGGGRLAARARTR